MGSHATLRCRFSPPLRICCFAYWTTGTADRHCRIFFVFGNSAPATTSIAASVGLAKSMRYAMSGFSLNSCALGRAPALPRRTARCFNPWQSPASHIRQEGARYQAAKCSKAHLLFRYDHPSGRRLSPWPPESGKHQPGPA